MLYKYLLKFWKEEVTVINHSHVIISLLFSCSNLQCHFFFINLNGDKISYMGFQSYFPRETIEINKDTLLLNGHIKYMLLIH